MVACEGVDAVEDDTSGDAVVPVPAGKIGVRAVRVQSDDEVWAPAADLPRHVTPQIAAVFELTVLIAQELHVLDAEYTGGSPLLFVSKRYQLLRRDTAIARPLVAVRHDDVGDLPTFPGQPCDGTAGQ